MKTYLIQEIINKGLRINSYIVKVTRVSRGRFREERNLVLNLFLDNCVAELLHMKIFFGRPPYYKPWIEVFNINPLIILGEEKIGYFDSTIEDALLDYLSAVIEPGDRLFIEYYRDHETLAALERGVPITATRLGYKLLKRGFTWFKDWYFPEGFMEGNPKLQAEKPISRRHRLIQLKEICIELINFIKNTASSKEPIIRKAYSRAKETLESLTRELECQISIAT